MAEPQLIQPAADGAVTTAAEQPTPSCFLFLLERVRPASPQYRDTFQASFFGGTDVSTSERHQFPRVGDESRVTSHGILDSRFYVGLYILPRVGQPSRTFISFRVAVQSNAFRSCGFALKMICAI